MVFVRVPEAGKVKTRLARVIGDEAACALYRCLVDDTLVCARCSGREMTLFFHPPNAAQTVRAWLGQEPAAEPQMGKDLGERMAAAFDRAFETHRAAVLIGSDIPDLPVSILDEAFESLETHDAVICPTRDGGYCLIGFSREGFTALPFRQTVWGGPRVFEDAMDSFRKRGSKVHVLPPWRDIDEYEDLRNFFRERAHVPRGTLSTVDFLRDRLGW